MKKILIIDYDQNSLASLQGIFATQGYQVVTAADGQTGWDKYNKESPDLVLMEAMLPKVHGFELCQRITSERNSQATVFIMTGVYKDRVYRTEALRTYGAAEYFEKPLKMTELLASVEAVLGKPEPRPAEARPAAPAQAAAPAPMAAAAPAAQEAHPAPAPVKHDKPRSDDSIFSLPDDLDRLSREIPKLRKTAAVRPEPSEPKIDAMAEELLKTVVTEAKTSKTVQPKPSGGNGNGNGNGADIDQFLKSALAGFDLEKEKVRVAKPVPQPPAPAKPEPAPQPQVPPKDKPVPPPVRAAAQQIRPAPPIPQTPPPPAPRPEKPFVAPPAADMKNTLTPGDPGSDVSPFFTPERPKPPVKPLEREERKAAPSPEPARREVPKPEPVRPEPRRPEVVKSEPAPAEVKSVETRGFAQARIFEDIAEPREKKGFPTVLAVGLGVVAMAAIGFVVLRPKRPAPIEPATQTSTETVTPSNVPAEPIQEPQAPVAKPAPARQKAQPQAKPADAGGASAILPTQSAELNLPLPEAPGGRGGVNTQPASGSNTLQADPGAAKTEQAPPPEAKTEANPSQNQGTDTAAVSEPAPAAAAPAPAAAPAKEGDLVELASVTEPPRIIKSVEPVYPQGAQRLRREGNVTINALIDEKGNVIDTGILKGLQDDMGLVRAAEIAVKKWKFQPARKNGVAVKVWKPFVIVFKAGAGAANRG